MQDKDTHGQTAESGNQSGNRLLYRKTEQKSKEQSVPDHGSDIVIEEVGEPVMYEIQTGFFLYEIAENGEEKGKRAVYPQGEFWRDNRQQGKA